MKLEIVLQCLRENEEEIRAAGVESISVFGSTARGDAKDGSDVDILVKYDRKKPMDLLLADRLRQKLTKLVGSNVDVVSEPILKPRLRDQIYRDHVVAF